MFDQALESESTSSSSNSVICKNKIIRKKREKYMKISANQRDQLLERVFFQNKKVKKAASELNINYSSAKTILFLHRKKVKAFLIRKDQSVKVENGLEEEKRCLYKIIPQPFIHNKVQIVTMQGGKKMFEKTSIFHGTPTKGDTRPSAFSLVKKIEDNPKNDAMPNDKEKLERMKKLFLFLLSSIVKRE